jgi:glycine/D-amino acid oxidase-like deaminating enzyme
MHPVVGRTPIDGFIVANGFSGHGFTLAPAIGSMIAQDLTGEHLSTDTRVPIEFLAWDRCPIELSSKSVLA